MPGAVADLAALGVDPAGQPTAPASATSTAAARADAPFRARARPRRPPYDAARGAGRRRGRRPASPIERARGAARSRSAATTCSSTASPPATSSPPTGCTRRCAGCSASTGRPAGRRRFGLRRHVAIAPWTPFVEVHWARPVGGLRDAGRRRPGRRRGAHRAAALASTSCSPSFPRARASGSSARPRSRVRGAGPLRQRSRRRVAGRVLLVGDAAGYVDALTGEGIALGLGPGAGRGRRRRARRRPSGYEAAWRRLGRRHELLTHALLRGDPAPAVLRRRIVPPAAAAAVGVRGRRQPAGEARMSRP